MNSSDSVDSAGETRHEDQLSSTPSNDIDSFMNNLDLSGIDFIRKANSSQVGTQKPLRATMPSVEPDPNAAKFNEFQYQQPYLTHERITPPEMRDWTVPRQPVTNNSPYYSSSSDPNVIGPRGVAERQQQPSFLSLESLSGSLPAASQPQQQQRPSPMIFPSATAERRPSYGAAEIMTSAMAADTSQQPINPYGVPLHMLNGPSTAGTYQRTPSPGWMQQQQHQQHQQQTLNGYPSLQPQYAQPQHSPSLQPQYAQPQHSPSLQQRDDHSFAATFDQMNLRAGEDPLMQQQQQQIRYPPRYPPVQMPVQQQPMVAPSYLNMHQQQQHQQMYPVSQAASYRPVLQLPQPPQLITRSPPRQQTFRQQTHPEVFPSATDVIYQVQFKRTFLYFVYYVDNSPQTQAFEPGDFVITECDRGEDLGMVVNIINLQIYHEHKHQDIKFLDEEVFRIRQIIRLATRMEREQLPIKYHDEQTVLNHCIEVVRNVFMLPMNVIDAEYQYDRTKLSIYYISDVRIDFREIVRHVFSTFQTRIWMKKSNRELSFEPVAYAVAALATGVPPVKSSLYRGDLGRGVGTPVDTITPGSGGYGSITGGTNSPFINSNGGY